MAVLQFTTQINIKNQCRNSFILTNEHRILTVWFILLLFNKSNYNICIINVNGMR
jgi:hypothetical protein